MSKNKKTGTKKTLTQGPGKDAGKSLKNLEKKTQEPLIPTTKKSRKEASWEELKLFESLNQRLHQAILLRNSKEEYEHLASYHQLSYLFQDWKIMAEQSGFLADLKDQHQARILRVFFGLTSVKYIRRSEDQIDAMNLIIRDLFDSADQKGNGEKKAPAYNFDALNFEGLDLSGLDLRRSTFREAKMNGVNLSKSLLNRSDLSRANLNHADLNEANLFEARMVETSASAANFFRANLMHVKGVSANFHSADFERSDIAGSILENANFEGANFYKTNFYKATLWGANMEGARLDRSNLAGAKLSALNLNVRSLTDTIFYVPGDGSEELGAPEDVIYRRLVACSALPIRTVLANAQKISYHSAKEILDGWKVHQEMGDGNFNQDEFMDLFGDNYLPPTPN